MNSKIIQSSRKESDRQEEKKWYSAIFARPEVGPISVLLILFCLLGYFSIPDGQFSLNPFSGEGFNALGIRNNFRVISQLGIVALGAGMLIIAGEFDLSVGSMIGFAGGCMAMILKWGFAFVIPYISFQGGFHFESITLFKINDPSPLTALLITLCFTLAFGWFQGWLIVKSGIASFIVTLGGLFFLRGVTETAYRAFNKSPDQTAGSTTVTDLPDIKNIINIFFFSPWGQYSHGEGREAQHPLHHVRPAQQIPPGLLRRCAGAHPAPGPSRRSGHDFHQCLYPGAAVRAGADGLYDQPSSVAQRGLDQWPHAQFGRADLGSCGGCGRLRDRADRSHALCGV